MNWTVVGWVLAVLVFASLLFYVFYDTSEEIDFCDSELARDAGFVKTKTKFGQESCEVIKHDRANE